MLILVSNRYHSISVNKFFELVRTKCQHYTKLFRNFNFGIFTYSLIDISSNMNEMNFVYEKLTYLNESLYYSIKSPVNCSFLNFIALYLLILFIASFNLNGVLLFIFWHSKPLRKANNFYMIAITFYNLIGSVVELPFVIQSSLMCK